MARYAKCNDGCSEALRSMCTCTDVQCLATVGCLCTLWYVAHHAVLASCHGLYRAIAMPTAVTRAATAIAVLPCAALTGVLQAATSGRQRAFNKLL